jgi:flagellar hook assembly protein FlgD
VLSVAGFGITRFLRSSDDIVNTVMLSPKLKPGGEPAEIRFATTIAEPDADVYVIDSEEEPVRALLESEPLAAGDHVFTWDARDDAGLVAQPGEYGLRVVLGEEGRDIIPPGAITVLPAPTKVQDQGED